MYTRIIWIYWAQGWDVAPDVCKKVKRSWEIYNPGWDIRAISKSHINGLLDMSEFPHHLKQQLQSDWIRLHLISKYGGVWVDATLLCMKPLDSWLPQKSPYFMFHGSFFNNHDKKGPCVWLIAANKNCYSVTKWADRYHDRWKNDFSSELVQSIPFNYFSLDLIWWDVYNNDTKFRDEWSKVPYFDSDEPGMLYNKFQGYSYEIEKILKTRPPPVIKLDYRMAHPDPETNMNVAIRLAGLV